MRISRKDKKKVRAIVLCYTGNRDCKKGFSKETWVALKREFIIWFRIISKHDRKNANRV